ncbi:MAG: hypothetical protein ACRC7S_05880, partial [Cetobacterium sp.]
KVNNKSLNIFFIKFLLNRLLKTKKPPRTYLDGFKRRDIFLFRCHHRYRLKFAIQQESVSMKNSQEQTLISMMMM